MKIKLKNKMRALALCLSMAAVISQGSAVAVSGAEIVPEDIPESNLTQWLDDEIPLDTSIRSLDMNNAGDIMDSLIPMSSRSSDIDIDLSISQKFRVTRPESEITVAFSNYLIFGTSNPDLPLYCDGEEVGRQGSKGTFAIYTTLEMGRNSFNISQGDVNIPVVINRISGARGKISAITQSSMFPSVQGGAKVGGVIPVSCEAPSGAKVTAKFGDNSVVLEQSSQASPGMPAQFKGELRVTGDYDADITQKIGAVEYVLNYNGAATSYKSTGSMYIAGENSAIAVKVTDYAGFVYPDLSQMNVIRAKVRNGAVDYVKSQSNNYFRLSSGGWLSTAQAKIIEGKVRVANVISDSSSSFKNQYEQYTFEGSRSPFYYGRQSDGVFYLTLYNTKGSPSVSVSSSKLFESAKGTEKDGYVQYAFKLKEGARIWGWNLAFDDGNIVLKFNYRPKLSSGSKPFEGIRVLLDPGHGGTDPGALGPAGKYGPDENMLNLAQAYAVRDKLEALGATVRLTRSTDDFLSLDGRLAIIESWDADVYLSIHHNAVGVNGNGNTASGMEVYYHTGYSQKLANSMMSGLAANVNRNNRFVRQSYYRVTLMPYAPAVLLELGFMSNPGEYERMTATSEIERTATGIAEGLKEALS